MIAIEQIHNEISGLQARYSKLLIGTKEYKKAEKRAILLRTCITYLELNPSVETIRKQLADVERKIQNASDGYQIWYDNTASDERGKNPKQTYRNVMGLKTSNYNNGHLSIY